MRKVFLKSALVFVGVLAVVIFAAILLGVWVIASEDMCQPPCDGAAMAATFILELGFLAGIVLALTAATATAVYLRLKH